MPLSVEAPVHILDEGPRLEDEVQWWWTALLRAQRKEIEATLGPYRVHRTLDTVEGLAAPSVLVVPAHAGGVVGKRDWWRFQELLWQYVRRGGIVVVLRQAFCLIEDGERAGGRTFEGISTRAPDNWMPGTVTFMRSAKGQSTGVVAEPLPRPLPTAFDVPTGHGFWVEHTIKDQAIAGQHLEILAHVAQREQSRPLALRLAYSYHEFPGAVLFLNTWSWMRRTLDEETRSSAAKAANREQAEFCFRCLRALNRELVLEALTEADKRLRQRTTRLELLCGERERLNHAMGSEKDYHRLLANDVELLLDLLATRETTQPGDLCRLFHRSSPWPEPPHRIGPDRRGRLDILLLCPGEDLERDSESLMTYLDQHDRKPVAWIELEAHAIDTEQILRFAKGMKAHLRPGDFVCAIDRSGNSDPAVIRVKEHLDTLNVNFLHVQVPLAFDHLEERYLPELHRLQRRRYTLDVIRGLLG